MFDLEVEDVFRTEYITTETFRIWCLHLNIATEWWILLFRACIAQSLIFSLASHLGFPNFYLHPWCPLWEGSDALHVSPVLLCLLLDREWTMADWQLAPPLWSAVVCCTVSHCHCGSQCGHWQAILDWNSSIPLSNQTNTTLKVNKKRTGET